MKTYLCLIAFTCSFYTSTAQMVKKIYLANDDHTDYMWSADESKYRQSFINMLDYYIAQGDRTTSLPTDFQGRFNADGNFWLWEYEKNKTADEFKKLISKVKSGHISVPYNALVSCYGGSPAEATIRGMYYAGYLERKFGLDLDMAVAMENQTLPAGLGSIWAGSGAKYSWKGICACASKMPGAGNRPHEVYWYKGLDDSRILMKWNTLYKREKTKSVPWNQILGGYAEARYPAETVHFCTTDAGFKAKYPYSIIGAFGKGWDDLETFTDEFIKVAQDSSSANRRVIVSNEADFFKDFEKSYGKKLPELTVAYGNEWDLYSASMAELSANVKRSVEKLRAAEAMATLLNLKDKSFAAGLDEMRRTAWMSLGLYYEHNWTADGPVSRSNRANWQRRIEDRITSYVDTLFKLSQKKLGEQIVKKGTNIRFYAFNPLSWNRTDVCDFPFNGKGNFRVVSLADRKEVPSQRITIKGKPHLRILAADIPPVGYKIVELRPAKPTKPAVAAAQVNGNTIENEYFKITLTKQGVITSLVDKVNGNRECVRKINGLFMNDLGSGADDTGEMTVENSGPVSVTIKCTGKLPLAHTSYITLFKGLKRVDIHNEINQNFGNVNSWAFSYNLDKPEVWHEEAGAILKAKLTTEGGHYATTNARYDWLTLNHFADINTGNYGLTLSSADCFFMKLGNSTPKTFDTKTPQINVLAGGQIDGQNLGIQKQGGDSLFTQRFALGIHQKFDAASAMRFSLAHQNPLVAGLVTGKKPGYPENSYSFLNISNPDALLWSLKASEEGIENGIIARVWNFGNATFTGKISFQNDVISAKQTTHIETDTGNAAVSAGDLIEPIGHHQIKTFRINLKNAWPSGTADKK